MKPKLMWLALSLAVSATACGGGVRRYEARPVLWEDDDRRPFSPAPRASYEPYFWDAIDHMIFRPASEVWTFEHRNEAINVNAVDEVPNSSWFTNRIGRRALSPDDVASGACGSVAIDVPAPWRIFAGKVDGASGGFMIEDANGTKYVLKVDRVHQAEQGTASEAITSSIFYAAGYFTPCYRVVAFTRDMLQLERDAEIDRTYGEDEPMTEGHVQQVLDIAHRFPDGRYRAVLSRFIDGEPIGPWSYMGTRDDDPNDVVPHQDRRELRGMYVLAAWVNRWDARDHNTITSFIEDPSGRGGHVRHYVMDVGETLGLIEGNDRRMRRFGHSQWLDVQHMFEDTLTLGLVARPWDSGDLGPGGEPLGYYDIERFEPDHWRPDYWNGAFERRTERDMAWGARIVARFERPHLEAIVRLGRYSNPATERELVRVLEGRRRRILERYLTRLSPLTEPVVRPAVPEVCMTDLAVQTGIRAANERLYGAAVFADGTTRVAEPTVMSERRGELVCVPIEGVRDGYATIDVVAETRGRERTGIARVHLVFTGDGWRLAGFERVG